MDRAFRSAAAIRGKSHVARFHAHLPRRKPLLVSDVEATGNFSYTCDRSDGANYLLLGDAYAFIDPVFSFGVLLAMNSAFVGAEAVDTCLRQPDKAAMALRHFVQAMKHGPKEFSWFIYRVTNPTMRNLNIRPLEDAEEAGCR